MQARTWIVVGLLTASALAVHHARGDASPAPVPVPRPTGAPARGASEPRAMDARVRVAAAGPAAPPVAEHALVDVGMALMAGIELDEAPGAAPDLNDAVAGPARTGAIAGVVRDVETGDVVSGVTVIVTTPAVDRVEFAITDESGRYRIPDLVPGPYTVTFYSGRTTVMLGDEPVVAGWTQNIPLVLDPADQVVIEPTPAPVIARLDNVEVDFEPDFQTDTSYVKNIPVGRTFEAVLGAAAGEQGDSLGNSVSDVDLIDNEYVITTED